MLSIIEIEQINQKLNPELALSLSLDNAKRMESSLLHSGFSPSTDMWKLILFYNGSLEEIKEMISFSFSFLTSFPVQDIFFCLYIKYMGTVHIKIQLHLFSHLCLVGWL